MINVILLFTIFIVTVNSFICNCRSKLYNVSKRCKTAYQGISSETTELDTSSLEKCLAKEYASFFNPMERGFYEDKVEFIDPMISISGIDKYQANVNMLAGRTAMGGFLFRDASINLHSITKLSSNVLMTRWTLRVTVKVLPSSPTARFSGVSIYTLSPSGKVVKQEDYWDSVNLKNGKYVEAPKIEGISDFLGQLKQDSGAEMAAPEMPYELLRRAKRYEVRRYPAHIAAQTTYDQRPEGYDRLGSFASGSNVSGEKVNYYSPTVMRVNDAGGTRKKLMSWPLQFQMPGAAPPSPSSIPEPTIDRVEIVRVAESVVAVIRFDVAATEPVVNGFTGQLLRDIQADGLVADAAVTAKQGLRTIAQYDALFSLNKRRNEVWVELSEHPWK